MASKILGVINLAEFGIEADLGYLNSVHKVPEVYDEFGQGYWKNVSIYNDSGRAGDSQYRNANTCLPTEHAARCPAIQHLLCHFTFEHLRMVRARNLVDGMVVPHRDFVELEQGRHYYRVFIALEKNNQAFHSDESGVFQMKAGEVWFLDAGITHSAVNFGTSSRLFLCLDYVFDQPVEAPTIFTRPHELIPPRQAWHVNRMPLDQAALEGLLSAAARLLNRHTFKDVVFLLSKYHFIYDVPVSACYDWLMAAAEMAGDTVVVDKARTLRRYLIEAREVGERYVLNDWPV